MTCQSFVPYGVMSAGVAALAAQVGVDVGCATVRKGARLVRRALIAVRVDRARVAVAGRLVLAVVPQPRPVVAHVEREPDDHRGQVAVRLGAVHPDLRPLAVHDQFDGGGHAPRGDGDPVAVAGAQHREIARAPVAVGVAGGAGGVLRIPIGDGAPCPGRSSPPADLGLARGREHDRYGLAGALVRGGCLRAAVVRDAPNGGGDEHGVVGARLVGDVQLVVGEGVARVRAVVDIGGVFRLHGAARRHVRGYAGLSVRDAGKYGDGERTPTRADAEPALGVVRRSGRRREHHERNRGADGEK